MKEKYGFGKYNTKLGDIGILNDKNWLFRAVWNFRKKIHISQNSIIVTMSIEKSEIIAYMQYCYEILLNFLHMCIIEFCKQSIVMDINWMIPRTLRTSLISNLAHKCLGVLLRDVDSIIVYFDSKNLINKSWVSFVGVKQKLK